MRGGIAPAREPCRGIPGDKSASQQDLFRRVDARGQEQDRGECRVCDGSGKVPDTQADPNYVDPNPAMVVPEPGATVVVLGATLGVIVFVGFCLIMFLNWNGGFI
jgi:hypothetical protein